MIRKELIRNYAESMELERSKLGLTQNEMAQRLDMSLSNYKKIISGETSNISLYVAHRMHELTGKWTFELCGEPSEEMHFIQKLRSLTDTQKRFINSILDIENQFIEKYDNPDDYISVYVPTGNMEDGMIYDSSNIIKVNAGPYRKKFGDDLSCGIKITSNHLHPVYNEGDIILICHKPIRDGDTGIFLNKETSRIYIRKLIQTHPYTLLPVNGYGNIITIDQSNKDDMEKWVMIGYVICKMLV